MNANFMFFGIIIFVKKRINLNNFNQSQNKPHNNKKGKSKKMYFYFIVVKQNR